MKEVFIKINEYVERHRQEMIDLWEKLVNIDSGTANGDGVREVCTVLRKEMSAIDMQTKMCIRDRHTGGLNPTGMKVVWKVTLHRRQFGWFCSRCVLRS